MSPKRPWFVLGILCIGFFMALLDGSIVTIAVPTLIGSIHASYDQVLWIIDAYLLVFSVLLITTGRLGDILGYKRLFVAGVATFTVASALCGLAGSPAQLLAARVLQGVGAAILFPQVISTILTVFPPQLRGRAFGVFGAIVGFAPVVGPIVGGFVLAHLGWRWIFLVNLPIGVLTVILAAVFVPDLRPQRRHGLDLTGVGLATAGLGGIVFGLIEGERLGWGTTIAASIVAGIVLVALFVGWQHVQRREPLMPLELFTAERSFPLGNAIGFVFQLGMISIALVLVLYLQNVLGYSPLQTALVLLPGAVLTAIGSAYAGRLSDRVGGKGVLAAGLAALALGLAVIVLAVRPDATAWQLMPGLVIIGIASGATFAPLQAVTMAGVEARLAGAAAGVSGTTRQIGGVLGTAALGAILSSTAGSAVRYEAEQRAGVLPAELRTSFVESTVDAARQFSPPAFREGDTALAERIGYEAFAAGFVSAMQVTLLVAAVALVVAALLCSGLESTPREVRSPARA